MMNTEMMKKIRELTNNSEADAKLEQAQSLAEVIEIAAEYGVTVTEAELTGVMTADGGEIGDEALEMVAGGGFKTIWSHIKSFFKGLAEGYDSYVS